jgi:hypothetical protein
MAGPSTSRIYERTCCLACSFVYVISFLLLRFLQILVVEVEVFR